MPIVQIDMLEGRTVEQRELVRKVTRRFVGIKAVHRKR